MTQNKNQIRYLDVNNLHGSQMSKFIRKSNFEWIDPKCFDSYN